MGEFVSDAWISTNGLREGSLAFDSSQYWTIDISGFKGEKVPMDAHFIWGQFYMGAEVFS